MGGECSVNVAQSHVLHDDEAECAPCHGSPACGVLPRRAAPCGLCVDGDGPGRLSVSAGPPGPPTPRGPEPPWAARGRQTVDLTATGRTPPRSPTPPRIAPPGLPEDDVRLQGPPDGSSMDAALGPVFTRSAFHAAKGGEVQALTDALQQLATTARALLSRAPGAPTGPAAEEQQRGQVADLVAQFLELVRDPRPPREHLLNAAARSGNANAVLLLLSAQANPSATDDQGCSALHRAAESGQLLSTVLILDRLQASSRGVCISELASSEGETPETLAAIAGTPEISRAFDFFTAMQSDAELRQFGSSSVPEPQGKDRGCSGFDCVTFIDTAEKAQALLGDAALAQLRATVSGNGLVRNVFKRIPSEQAELQQMVDDACRGFIAAEESLLAGQLAGGEAAGDTILRSFMATAEPRAAWQRLRTHLGNDATDAQKLKEFWHTHLCAETMAATLANAMGDTFQLLLTVLWLYTRESWLRHVLDTLACALAAAGTPHLEGKPTDGATGAAPAVDTSVADNLQTLVPLVSALAPFAQLVQSALGWFEEAGIRYSGITYRPLAIPMLRLQHLVDRFMALRSERATHDETWQASHDSDGSVFDQDAWVALGGGSFFSSTSSRQDALQRLLKRRCNALLVIRPDERNCCFPKQMSLRGAGVDDVLFPLGAIFRITRVTRTVSSELAGGSHQGTRWPVTIVEVAASSQPLASLELLSAHRSLDEGERDVRLEQWANGAPDSEASSRCFAAGELLAIDGDPSQMELAVQLLGRAASTAEASGDTAQAARSYLALARLRVRRDFPGTQHAAEVDGRRALRLLKVQFGEDHPETCSARAVLRELGIKTTSAALAL